MRKRPNNSDWLEEQTDAAHSQHERNDVHAITALNSRSKAHAKIFVETYCLS